MVTRSAAELVEEVEAKTSRLVNFVDETGTISKGTVVRARRLTAELADAVKDLDEWLEDYLWELGG